MARLQSIISKEIKEQLARKTGRDYPDYLIACIGGGSNAAGTIYHYIDDERVKIVLAEAGGQGADTGHTAATIHAGSVGILHGSRTLVMQTPDGQIMEAESISAGLDYPGIGPMHAALSKMHFNSNDVVVLTVSGRGDKDVETYLANKAMAGEYGTF